MTASDRRRLEELLKAAGLDLTQEQLNLLWRFNLILIRQEKDQSLVGFDGFEDLVLKHDVDSMWVTRLTEIPSPLLDLGTGAGFPGIPLKILRPDLELILAEPRAKRVQFLKSVCKELRLEKVDIVARTVSSKTFHQPVQGVITRAVEEMAATLDRVGSFLPLGGRVIFMKGPAVEKELEVLKMREDLQKKFCKREDHAYKLPVLDHKRRLLVFEKIQ